MSRFFSDKLKKLVPYTPGEQPKNMEYIKLNTNESPFAPSPKSVEYAKREIELSRLYSDPECTDLVSIAAEHFGINKDEILFTNGSDEILNFAFMAFCDNDHPAYFPDITYGFYTVFADVNNVPYTEIPLKNDFCIDLDDYKDLCGVIFIANPNAPTGIALSLDQIESIIKANPESVVVIDEAYVDFGAESAVPLIKKYDNLLVTQTFSKSRSMAGARLGFGIGCKELIKDLNTIKYSTNPYNVNRVTMAAGKGSLEDREYTEESCKKIIATRERTKIKLKELGFEMTESLANFIFAKHPEMAGEDIYLRLKEKGILVRHFSKEKLTDYNRITVGTDIEMDSLIKTLEEILGETYENN